MKYAYFTLRENAKRRGKPFTITLAEFSEFCFQTFYLIGKGRRRESFSIDCIDPGAGYTKENIRVLPFGENSRKGCKILHYDWETGYAVYLPAAAGI